MGQPAPKPPTYGFSGAQINGQPVAPNMNVPNGNIVFTATATVQGHSFVVSIVSVNGPFHVLSAGLTTQNYPNLTATWTNYNIVGNGQILRVEEYDPLLDTWTTTDTFINIT